MKKMFIVITMLITAAIHAGENYTIAAQFIDTIIENSKNAGLFIKENGLNPAHRLPSGITLRDKVNAAKASVQDLENLLGSYREPAREGEQKQAQTTAQPSSGPMASSNTTTPSTGPTWTPAHDEIAQLLHQTHNLIQGNPNMRKIFGYHITKRGNFEDPSYPKNPLIDQIKEKDIEAKDPKTGKTLADYYIDRFWESGEPRPNPGNTTAKEMLKIKSIYNKWHPQRQ